MELDRLLKGRRRWRTVGLAAVVLAATGTAAAPAALAQVQAPHFVVIMMENHGLYGVQHDPADMPYLNSLWNSGGERLTNYYSVYNSSLPNYMAIASGYAQGPATGAVSPGQIPGPSVWDQLTAAGMTWAVYQEAMPKTCWSGKTYNDALVTNGQYTIAHNPATPFSTVYYNAAECSDVQPLSALNPASLPAVAFITPNQCDDMHGLSATTADKLGYSDCVAGSDALEQRSDTWLSRIVPELTAAGATVLVTFDEGGGGHVYAVLTGAGITPNTSWTTKSSHYGTLAAIEDAFGLPLLGNAATAAPIPVG